MIQRFPRSAHFCYGSNCGNLKAAMSHAEAHRGMARLTVFAEALALPTPGPSGPIEIGPGGGPSGMPYNVPATEPAIPARGGGTRIMPDDNPRLTDEEQRHYAKRSKHFRC